MVIAMTAMRVVQPAVHQVVNVIAMRHRGMTAVWPMDMVLGMAAHLLLGGTLVRMLGIHLDDMKVNAGAFLVFQMAGLQVIGMTAMLDRDVSAPGAVLVL
jgi:hypothetical protein